MQNNQSLTQEVLLHRIANRIRQSLELQEILSATVAEVRFYLETDRVKIYQFNPDSSGLVIAESIQEDRLPSLLGLNFPADDIPPYARELFVRARQRSLVDLSSQEIGLSPLDCTETGDPLEKTDIHYRPVDPCHVEYLTAMGVKSSVVVPIVLASQEAGQETSPLRSSAQLWGLLVSHHSEARVVSEEELALIQAVVDQVSIAIAQSILLNQVRDQARQEANINRVTALLYTSPTVQLEAALEETVAVFQGVGGRLYLLAGDTHTTELYTCGEQPVRLDQGNGRPIEENLLWHKYLFSAAGMPPQPNHADLQIKPWSVKWMRAVYALSDLPDESNAESNIWAIGDIYKEPLFRAIAPSFQSTRIRGLLIVPLLYGIQVVGCLTIFRPEVDTETLWAGCNDTDTRQLMPRQSFEAWRELKTGQAQQWTEAEIKLAQALGERFSMATKQYRLYQQVQSFNTNLEHQVIERTAQLQQSVEQQKTLAKIIAKIREYIELDSIFSTVATEVRQVLNADRVVVYRYHSEGGDVIAEDVLPDFDSTLKVKFEDRCTSNQLLEKYHQGEIHAIGDIHNAGLHPCYVQMLSNLQVIANLVIPLFKDDKLWGLLCIHQCNQPRSWQPLEIEFIVQIGSQLGVALQHAMLLTRTRKQTEQLSQMLDHLKQTQTHLIHSEKMSSLGQLVAGVAHEFNNPVNFISGNLTHVHDYTHNLLHLLSLYQQHYPDPVTEIQEQAELADLNFVAEDIPKLFASLQLGADRIREIVSSLRSFSRLDQAEIKPINIHKGIDSTLLILQHRLKPTFSRPGIQIIKQYGDLPLVEGFAVQLNQVFINLLGNAIDAIQDLQDQQSEAEKIEGIIKINTKLLESNWIQICIKDNGIGIPPLIQKKLFDPFFTTKPSGKGIGLGLFISYQIIEQQGGRLQCYPQTQEGAEFIIEVPLKQESTISLEGVDEVSK